MTLTQSDSESNVSGFIEYSPKNFQDMYESVLEDMETINRELQEMRKDLKYILTRVGPMERQLSALLEQLPKQNLNATMETE